ncbi:transglutaminase family protein [Azospirillum halopraeferens]|uniref:transglutaminase family protein n=1 Tax=Azospirillum halopraeferens TaxID=34010 RepID=UPI00048A8730|nr:transglutaminase family protein [Azospirillum halopraeferens]
MPSPDPPEAAAPQTAAPAVYRVRHVTAYDYGEAVPLSHHLIHLAPRPHPRQRCRSGGLTIDPPASVRTDRIDYFGNPVTYVAIQEPHRRFAICAEHVVEVADAPLPDTEATPPWDTLRQSLSRLPGPDDAAAIAQYAFDSALVRASPELAAFAAPSFTPGRPVASAACDLMRRVHTDFTFDPTATTVATPLAEVMATRRGVCQDFAHVMIGCLRSQGLPARYVSGYLRTVPPPGQPRLIGADASHAWVSVWCGGGDWLDLCPTNDRIVDRDFITIARGRDYDDVSPMRGVLVGGAGHGLTVQVDVEPLDG